MTSSLGSGDMRVLQVPRSDDGVSSYILARSDTPRPGSDPWPKFDVRIVDGAAGKDVSGNPLGGIRYTGTPPIIQPPYGGVEGSKKSPFTRVFPGSSEPIEIISPEGEKLYISCDMTVGRLVSDTYASSLDCELVYAEQNFHDREIDKITLVFNGGVGQLSVEAWLLKQTVFEGQTFVDRDRVRPLYVLDISGTLGGGNIDLSYGSRVEVMLSKARWDPQDDPERYSDDELKDPDFTPCNLTISMPQDSYLKFEGEGQVSITPDGNDFWIRCTGDVKLAHGFGSWYPIQPYNMAQDDRGCPLPISWKSLCQDSPREQSVSPREVGLTPHTQAVAKAVDGSLPPAGRGGPGGTGSDRNPSR